MAPKTYMRGRGAKEDTNTSSSPSATTPVSPGPGPRGAGVGGGGGEPVDEDADGAAAGQADLEGLVVGYPVRAELGRAPREDRLSLLVDGGLDTASGDRAGHLALLGDREHGARG